MKRYVFIIFLFCIVSISACRHPNEVKIMEQSDVIIRNVSIDYNHFRTTYTNQIETVIEWTTNINSDRINVVDISHTNIQTHKIIISLDSFDSNLFQYAECGNEIFQPYDSDSEYHYFIGKGNDLNSAIKDAYDSATSTISSKITITSIVTYTLSDDLVTADQNSEMMNDLTGVLSEAESEICVINGQYRVKLKIPKSSYENIMKKNKTLKNELYKKIIDQKYFETINRHPLYSMLTQTETELDERDYESYTNNLKSLLGFLSNELESAYEQ